MRTFNDNGAFRTQNFISDILVVHCRHLFGEGGESFECFGMEIIVNLCEFRTYHRAGQLWQTTRPIGIRFILKPLTLPEGV